MNWIDVIIILVLIGGSVLGVISGFIWQIARILLLIIAAYATFLIHPLLANWLVGRMENQTLASLIIYLVVFTVIYLILFFITWFIEKSMAEVKLKPLDRVIGGVLGFLKTALICGTILLGMVHYPGLVSPNSLKESFLSPHLLRYTHGLVFLMPQDYRDKVYYFIHQTREVKNEPVKTEKTENPK